MDLMRFRVSPYWWVLRVLKNDFFDKEPVAENGRLPSEFSQDILSMQRRRPITSGIGEPDYILDLGWYPDQNPSGAYRLVLLGADWDDVLASVETPDRFAIRDAMERWMGQIERARDRNQLVRWLSKDA